MNDILNDELNSAFIANEKQFKGETIAPYTEGSRLLLLQVRDEQDSSVFFIWAFLYMHIQLAKSKKDAIKLAWNKDLFREKVMDWVANKNEQDRIEATNIVSTIIEESQKGQVELIGNKAESGNA
ncbi:MAG: hypothetical protein EBR82_35340 [Caulobacteraceae bacterium]|nr:hypothetical protein [Caulobacteraceae bacterium]